MDSIAFPIVVFISMAAWGFLHSWMASFANKKLARRYFGEKLSRYYRLIFIAVAGLTLFPILAMPLFFPAKVLWRIPPPWLIVTIALQLLALVAILVTFLYIDWMAFIGFRQLTNPDAERENRLVIRGMYRFVRHPLYLFSIILLWLIPWMTDVLLAFVIASTLYFIIGTIPEERKLLDIYGDQYRRYQEQVPRIIPGINI